MSNFESIFIPLEDGTPLQKTRMSRLKMGEIFQCGRTYALVCIHCSTEFTSFPSFSMHAQVHLMDICSQMSVIADEPNYENSLDESHELIDTINAACKKEDENDSIESARENNSAHDAIGFDDDISNDSAESGEMSQCPLCSKSFSTINGLQTHLHDDHKRMYATDTIKLVDKQPHGIDIKKPNGKRTFSSRSSKEEYANVQKKLRGEGIELDNSACALEFFKYIYDFDDMTADSIDVFQCPQCSHTGRQMSKMRTHIFKHLVDNIFVCIECKRRFHRVGAVRQHIQKMHVRRKGGHQISKCISDSIRQQDEVENATNVKPNIRKLRIRKKIDWKSCTESDSSSESSYSRDDDESVYDPKDTNESDECTDNDNDKAPNAIAPNAAMAESESSDSWTENAEQKEVMLTSDDFQQHSKAQIKFKRKYIQISDTSAAIEYAKYALMSDFKSSSSIFHCPKCTYSCAKFYEMRRHIFTHLKEKIFTCMFCKRKSNRLLRMEWHVSDHVKNNSKKLFEKLADKLPLADELPKGKLNKQLAIVRKKLNPHCIQLEDSPEGIKYAKYYLLHDIKRTDGHFECSECHALILSRNSIRKHLFRHIKTEIFSCMICHGKFSLYELVRRHMKQKHSNHINKIDVDDGPQSSEPIKYENIEEDLNMEIAALKDKARVLCTICGTSVKASGLKKHVNIHERNADFKCDLCDKSFLRKCKLLDHRRTHPEPMPYHCAICNKGYLLRRGLVRHLTTHGKDTE